MELGDDYTRGPAAPIVYFYRCTEFKYKWQIFLYSESVSSLLFLDRLSGALF